MTAAESQTVLNGTFATVPIFNEILLPLDGIELKAVWENAFAKLEFEVYENVISLTGLLLSVQLTPPISPELNQ